MSKQHALVENEGLAHQLFQEKAGKKLGSEKAYAWPLLSALLQKKQLPYIDFAIAEKLLGEEGEEAHAAFLCHLSLASREGHLCVTLENEAIIPSPELLWKACHEESTALAEIQQDDLSTLSHLIVKGGESLPKRLYEGINGLPLLKRDGNRIYFFRHWSCETLFLDHFFRLQETIPKVFPNEQLLKEKIDNLITEKKLLPEQAQAIANITSHSLSILCGGPGTGKTYTAGMLLKLLWQALSTEQQQQFKMAIAAPTGKAASNLQASLNRATESLTDFPSLKAKTLHTLLGKELTTGVLDADLILVDESSMIDVHMMAKLFQAIKPGARLLLLGDPFQLPSIEAGSLFADIVEACANKSNLTTLKHCMRTELKSILAFADAVNKGNYLFAKEQLTADPSSLHHHPLENEREIRPLHLALLKTALSHYPHTLLPGQDPIPLLQQFSRYRILSPLRQGPLGVDQLNLLFLKALASHQKEGTLFIAPIMIATNNHRLELFNGEVGLLIRKSPAFQSFEEGDYALFPSQDPENPIRSIPAVLLPRFEYAYCLSVHKSQGSEFEELLLLLPEGAELFGREGFYTGITRAKKKLTLWCNEKTMQTAIKNHSRRHSGIHIRTQQ